MSRKELNAVEELKSATDWLVSVQSNEGGKHTDAIRSWEEAVSRFREEYSLQPAPEPA